MWSSQVHVGDPLGFCGKTLVLRLQRHPFRRCSNLDSPPDGSSSQDTPQIQIACRSSPREQCARSYINGRRPFLSTSRPPSLPAASFKPRSCIPSHPEVPSFGPGGGSSTTACASPDATAPSRFCAFHRLLVRLLDGLDWGSVLHRAPLSALQGSRHAYILG